jgi:adenosylcobinamide-phosphate synthase
MYILLAYLHGLNPAAYVIAGALVLKSAFTVKGLRSAAVSVRKLLAVGKSQQARYEVKSLVGRETEKLDDSQVASAVVESVAENSCDSLVAPLLYFLVFGIPGAVAYRIINTFDAMIGHHGRYEYLGKFAARLDDAANYIPARLSALLLAAAAGIARFDMAGAWRTMRRDHRLTESPNGGWTMSAAAGALGLTLEKAGYYRLGEGGETPTVTAIDRSLILLTVQASLWLTLCLAVEVTRAACA